MPRERPHLEQASAWQRPAAATDKLFMSIGGGDLIEVGHPAPRPGQDDPRAAGLPVLHLGPVAAGRGVALDDQLRQEFAYKNGVLAYDSELDSVVEVTFLLGLYFPYKLIFTNYLFRASTATGKTITC